jgi:MYXO-CTERM domain-containing protein
VVLTAACAAATLVNPYFTSLYGVVYEYVTQTAPFQAVVDELTAPSFRSVQDWAGLALFGAAAFALGRRRKPSAFDVLLLAATAVLAFRAKRDFWFLAVTALAILAKDFPAPVPRPRRLRVELVGGLAFSAVAVVLFGWALLAQDDFLQKDMEKSFPVKAVAFVKEHGYPGPLFNHFGWGGYLIWNLPGLPVSIDGRTNLYGPQRIGQVFNTTRGLPGWDADPNLRAANVVILDRNLPLAELLRLDKRRFEKVYEDAPEDGIAIVFLARK